MRPPPPLCEGKCPTAIQYGRVNTTYRAVVPVVPGTAPAPVPVRHLKTSEMLWALRTKTAVHGTAVPVQPGV
jgi:hypothetical protein